ncbi:MAG TPA: NAD-dependent epimerase/dehydratase family protein [Candidatus Paceibacterota bacterium]|nr:NAD-dependent epimerase/dehydratase family protein [Candidatus Paceibacterota bacterium]
MNTKTAIVTGGAGFIGSALVRELLAQGYEVRVIDTLVASSRERVPAGVPLFEIDVRDAEKLIPACAGASIIFHLAALPRVQYSIEHPLETHEVNVTGTLNILTAAKAVGAKRVVLASSAAVYGDREAPLLREEMPAAPVSPYGLHKYASEKYLALAFLLYGISTVSLRFFNVYGPGLDPNGPYALVIGRFLKLRKEGKPLTIFGDGTQTRDFIHVRDIVAALIVAGESTVVGKGEVLNVGTGRATSVNELADLFGGERESLPPRAEPRASCADISQAKTLLGFEPRVSLKEGIEELKREWDIA